MTTSGPILVLGDRAGSVAGALTERDGIEVVDDLDGCLSRARALRAEGHPPRLVALAPDVASPLTVGRRLRGAEPRTGIAYIVAPDEVSETEARLAFVPDLTEVSVVPRDPIDELGDRIASAASAATERTRVASALDVMNRELADPGRRGPRVRPGVSEHYLATLTRHAPDAIVSIDRDGSVVATNAAAVALLGISDHHSEGRKLEELLDPVDPPALHRLVAQVGRGETPDDVELTIRRPADDDAILSITAAPVRDHAGDLAGSVFVARDVTEQRRTDERLRFLERSERLATLAGGVAHDFNNLLVTIQGWATMAAADLDDTELVGTALEHITTASERAAELARAMLAYGGRAESDPRPCEVTSLISGMSPLFAAGVPRRISVHLDLAPDLPQVDADHTQLRQVALNLVTNAAEAIGDTTGSIRVATRLADPEHDPVIPTGHVVVEVEDSGPGMDAATTQRVFDPFFTTKFAGRGLGLAASSGIVRAHGGTIRVHSEPGKGARFTVALPPRDRGTT